MHFLKKNCPNKRNLQNVEGRISETVLMNNKLATFKNVYNNSNNNCNTNNHDSYNNNNNNKGNSSYNKSNLQTKDFFYKLADRE